MAPPKKPEADKAKKINFTLSPAMFEAFKQKCLQEGKEISKTLQALIETFLNNDQNPPPVSAHTIEGDDKSLIQSLQARIEKLEQEISRNDNPVINTHSINIESTHDETSIIQTQKAGIDVLPVTPMEVSPEPITVNSVPGNEVSVKKPVIVKNSRLNKHFEGDVPVFVQTFEEWMKNKGYTQKSFQDAYGFSLSAVSKWKNGSRPLPMDKYDLISAIMKGEILPSKED